MPRSVRAELNSVVVGSYDQTKTTVQGRVTQKIISGKNVLGPQSNRWMDVFTDTGLAPAGAMKATPNGRIFLVTAEAAGLASVILYNFDYATGVSSYVGRIQFALPDVAATTHVYRVVNALDSGTTGWKIMVGTTGSVAINGGLFMLNNIDLADFVPIGFPTIPFATGNSQKAVYNLQATAETEQGAGHLMTSLAGGFFSGNNFFAHNGVSATHQYWVFNTSLAPTWASATGLTIDAGNDLVTHVGHTFNNNDPVVFTSLVGGTGLVVGTVYFVRNPTATTYGLSATSGGANINVTVSYSNATIGRAFGTTGALFSYKTGNLPALAGTLLANDSEDLAVPQHNVLIGQTVAAFGTSSTLYFGLVSELTAGVTTWPSLNSSNANGSASEIVAPVLTQLNYSQALDRFVFLTNISLFVTKQHVNNALVSRFGCINQDFYEGVSGVIPELGMIAITGMDTENGWLFITATATAGQRGIIAYDMRSDSTADFSFIVTKVLDIPRSTVKTVVPIIKRLVEKSNPELSCFYRTSGFGSISGGWTQLALRDDISLGVSSQIQFKILFNTARAYTTNPAQLIDLVLEVLDDNEVSSNWAGNDTWTDSASPAKTAYRLVKAYASGTVPKLYHRAINDSGVAVVDANTVDDAASFEYSVNNGSSWTALGTIPNTVGTLLRYNWVSPPGVEVTSSLREE